MSQLQSDEEAPATTAEEGVEPHSAVASFFIFLVCLAAFVAGFYLMGMHSAIPFVGGLLLSIAALFVPFQIMQHISND